MEDAALVGVVEAFAELTDQLQGVEDEEGAAVDARLEGPAGEEVLDQVGDGPLEVRGVDADDVGVVEAPEGLGFAPEALELFADALADPRQDRLEGEGDAARLVDDLVDRAHSTARELASDPVGAEVGRDPEALEGGLVSGASALAYGLEGPLEGLARDELLALEGQGEAATGVEGALETNLL